MGVFLNISLILIILAFLLSLIFYFLILSKLFLPGVGETQTRYGMGMFVSVHLTSYCERVVMNGCHQSTPKCSICCSHTMSFCMAFPGWCTPYVCAICVSVTVIYIPELMGRKSWSFICVIKWAVIVQRDSIGLIFTVNKQFKYDNFNLIPRKVF